MYYYIIMYNIFCSADQWWKVSEYIFTSAALYLLLLYRLRLYIQEHRIKNVFLRFCFRVIFTFFASIITFES